MKVGDTVRFLNSVGGGRVVRLDGQLAYVEDEDGFEVPVLARECVIVAAADDSAMIATVPDSAPSAKTANAVKTPTAQKATGTVPIPALPIEEVEGGDKINLTIAFTASDLKRLSDPSVTYDTFLINDSNYYLSYTLATRTDGSDEWSILVRGEIEPNIQEFVAEITREMLPGMDRIAVQYTAYKTSKPYAFKEPGSIDLRLDTTKFFKLHCFKPSDYFDEPVIELPLIIDDRPAGSPVAPDPEILRRNLLKKKRNDNRRPRPIERKTTAKKSKDEPIVVDLHITELVDSTRGLSNADMLNMQIDAFREVMQANLRNKGQKLIFIHGKGEGVLRAALMKELSHRFKGNDVQDASFREYGFGATQVTIK